MKYNIPLPLFNEETRKILLKDLETWTDQEISTAPKTTICGCLGKTLEIEKILKLCKCNFRQFVYENHEYILNLRSTRVCVISTQEELLKIFGNPCDSLLPRLDSNQLWVKRLEE